MNLINLIVTFTLATPSGILISQIDNIYGVTENDLAYKNVATINIRCCVNSSHNMGLMIFNIKPKNLELSIIIDSLKTKHGRQSVRFATIYDCRTIRTRNGKYTFDPLIESPKNTFFFRPKETKFLWFNFSSKELSPQVYESNIKLVDNATKQVYMQIPLMIDVVPIFLPRENPLSVQLWAYLDAPTIGGYKEQAVTDLYQHGANVFVLPYYLLPRYSFSKSPKMTSDFQKLDSTVSLLSSNGKFLIWLGLEFSDIRESKSVKFMSTKWKSEIQQWLIDIINYFLDKLGGYDKFAIYPIDEGNHGTLSLLDTIAPFIKQIDPNVLIYFNPGEKLTLSDLQRIAPYIDIWQPHISLIKEKTIRDFLLKTNKPIWSYACATSVRAISPYTYYRLLPWLAWYYNLNGIGFWTYSVPEKNVWNDFDGRWGDNCVIYNGENGIVGSRRWEAFAEGIDDSKILFIAMKCLTVDTVRAVIQKVVEHDSNEKLANEIRQSLISLILSERKNHH